MKCVCKEYRMFALPLFLLLAPLSCGAQKTNEAAYDANREPIVPQKEYTRDNPAEWEPMVDQLVPQLSFSKGFGRDIIIRVPLKNPGGDNYIEKIGIMTKDGKEIVSQAFGPKHEFFEAQFFSSQLPADKSNLVVFSKSSLYDMWTTPFVEK